MELPMLMLLQVTLKNTSFHASQLGNVLMVSFVMKSLVLSYY
jgi:hypothetical protein